MAFVLPLIAGGIGSLGGFVAGYYINQPDEPTSQTTTERQITEMPITAHKEINHELITFNRASLKPMVPIPAKLTDEQKIMTNLRQKITDRRAGIQPM